MTPIQLKAILDDLGLSGGKFALLLGASRRSGAHWIDPSKSDVVPPPVATIAWMLQQRPALLAMLERRRDLAKAAGAPAEAATGGETNTPMEWPADKVTRLIPRRPVGA